jgi:hypothetical protein
MDASVKARVDGLAAEACIELFGAYGHDLAPATDVLDFQDDLVLSAVIGFGGGGLRGTCLVATNQGLLRSSCPVFCRARDWVGEIANQLIGRLKMKLLRNDVDVMLTTPLAFCGVQLTPSPLSTARPQAFVCSTGFVTVWLEIDVARTFAFGSLRPLPGETGELLVF